MSPEQARGEPLDHRTDIFSLGAIFHELVTGRRLFRGEHVGAIVHAVLNLEIPSLTLLRADAPRGLDRVLGRALARERSERYASMSDFAADLQARDVRSLSAAVTAAPLQPLSPVRSKRALAGVLVTVVATAIGGWLWSRSAGGPSPSEPVETRPAFSASAQPDSALGLVQQGTALLRRFDRAGNVDLAITSLESAIALDKSFAPAWAWLARGYWRKQTATRDRSWSARAVDAARQAVKLNPYLADAQVSLGLVLLAAGDVAEAERSLKQALTLNPKSADAHRGLAELAESQHRGEDASLQYQRAMALAPDDWELPRVAGNIPFGAGRYAEALALYQKAGRIAPDSAHPLNVEGAAHHMLGDYSSAASAFQKAIAIQPTGSVYTNLGTALFFQGLYADSIAAFERAVELQPSSPVAWGNLGDAYRVAPGYRDKSLEAYRRGIQLLERQLAADPTHVANQSRLALYYAKAGDAAAAKPALAKVLAASPKDLSVLYRAAVTSELVGDRARALSLLEQAMAGGYAMREIVMDPELTALRGDVRYHRLESRFQGQSGVR